MFYEYNIYNELMNVKSFYSVFKVQKVIASYSRPNGLRFASYFQPRRLI